MGTQRIWSRFSRKARLRRVAAGAVLDRAERPGADGQLVPGAVEPALASELGAMQSLVATLNELPREAWDHGVPPAAGAGPIKVRRWVGPRQTLALVAVTACLVVAFLVGSLTHPTLSGSSRLSAQTPRVTLAPLPGTDRDSHAVAYMTGDDGMHLRVRHLAPSAPGTYYELWLMSSDSDLVSVTSFRVGSDGRAELTLRLPAEPSHYRFLDISVQRVGAGTAISGDSVLRGAVG